MRSVVTMLGGNDDMDDNDGNGRLLKSRAMRVIIEIFDSDIYELSFVHNSQCIYCLLILRKIPS